MRKSLMALAALATAGIASAQSSVTVFGVIDVNVQHTSGSLAGRTAVDHSGVDGSHIGFRGTEDLGGGMSASFWLEADIAPDAGHGNATNTNNQFSGTGPDLGGRQGLTFNRRSTVSLAGAWGEVRLGRDFNTTLRNLGYFDPFWAQGVGGNQMVYSIGWRPTTFRASNSVAYLYNTNGWWSPGGFYGTANYYMGENASNAPNSKDGTGYGVRVGYKTESFDVAVATSSTRYLTGDYRQTNIGGSYELGFASLRAQLSRDSVGSDVSRGVLVGAMVPVGAGVIRGSYSAYKTRAGTEPGISKWSVGYMHNLSKRTMLYATFARLKNSGGSNVAFPGAATAVDGTSTGYEFGIKHNF